MSGPLYSNAMHDSLIILGAAGLVIPTFARFKVSPVIGFILIGIAVGPFGLARLVPDYPWLAYITISNTEVIEPFAELGIILLLFSIGLELSFKRLWSMRKKVFGVGAGELFGGGAALAIVLHFFGYNWMAALGLGLALTLSSTALVLPIAGTRGKVGQNAFAMLLFEDLALVPIIFLLGALAPMPNDDQFGSLASILMSGGITIAILVIGGWLFLPTLFGQAARAKNPELFLAASLLVVIAASLATANAGLSPIVGALIAGLLIAETDYHTEVEGIIAPFRGLALGVFLLTVGMQVDLVELLRNWPQLFGAVIGVIVIKALVTGLLLRWAGVRKGTAAEVGLLMGSPSETTLIVLATAVQAGIVAAGTAAFWQVVTAIGLTITPLLAQLGRRLSRQIDRAGQDVALQSQDKPHVLIIGFGRVGQIVADMLSEHNRAYLAVEADVDAVAAGQKQGYNVYFGDAGRARFLERFNELTLSAAVLTMDDPAQQVRLVRKLRARHPDMPIICRARDIHAAADLYRAGASDAVPEALEGSLQMAEAVLVDVGVAVGPVIASVHEMRAAVRQHIKDEADLDIAPRARTAPRRNMQSPASASGDDSGV